MRNDTIVKISASGSANQNQNQRRANPVVDIDAAAAGGSPTTPTASARCAVFDNLQLNIFDFLVLKAQGRFLRPALGDGIATHRRHSLRHGNDVKDLLFLIHQCQPRLGQRQRRDCYDRWGLNDLVRFVFFQFKFIGHRDTAPLLTGGAEEGLGERGHFEDVLAMRTMKPHHRGDLPPATREIRNSKSEIRKKSKKTEISKRKLLF